MAPVVATAARTPAAASVPDRKALPTSRRRWRFDGSRAGWRGESRVGAVGGADRVGGDHPVVVCRFWCKADQVGVGGMGGVIGAEQGAFGREYAVAASEKPVFEVVGSGTEARLDSGAEHRGCRSYLQCFAFAERGKSGGGEGLIGPPDGAGEIGRDGAEVVCGCRCELRDFDSGGVIDVIEADRFGSGRLRTIGGGGSVFEANERSARSLGLPGRSALLHSELRSKPR